MNWLFVGIGGFLGAVARYGVYRLLTLDGSRFPWATLSVNLLGSLILGVLFAAYARQTGERAGYLLAAVGFCGSFTTFSTFSLDALKLAQQEAWSIMLLYLVGSVALGLLLAFVGYKLAS